MQHTETRGTRESYRTLAKRAALVCGIAAVAALAVVRFNDVCAVISAVWSVLAPFAGGFALAYVLNLVMSFLERIYFPHSQNTLVARTRRPACLILSLALIAALVCAVTSLMADEIRTASQAVGQGALAAMQKLGELVGDDPELSALLAGDPDEWLAAAERALASIGGAGGAASTVARWGGNVAHAVLDGVIAVIFALYVLISKERVIVAARSFARITLPPSLFKKGCHVCHVANDSFSRFISGQCLEACILGALVALGMTVFGFPYAGTIGLFVGITSVIPFIGAWIGGAVGAFIIASVSIEQALMFVVFLVVLQQIEGHLIYPNVVGSQVGMPGIWTFFAVVAGGALFGMPGVLLGVPVVSTVRTLVLEWKTTRETSLQPTDSPTQPNEAVQRVQ